MKKIIITVFAFLALFGFAVSGAMAQTWETFKFITEATPTPILVNIQVGDDWLEGTDNNTDWVDLTQGDIVIDSFEPFGDSDFGDGTPVSVIGPNGVEYVIDENTVGYRLPTCQPGGSEAPLIAFAVQPIVPADGKFVAITVSDDSTVYILFELSVPAAEGQDKQYILAGTSFWTDAMVRFMPRSLNQSSHGKWVTCKVSGLPDGYAPADVNLESLCIVSVNGETLADPIERSSDGPFNNRNKRKLMVKFDRAALIDAIPDVTGNVEVTVVGTLGEDALPFFATDTFKTKYKVKKNPK